MPYRVTKTYGHERGLSACFRQWRATHSHCSLLHGYALSVELVFESDTLDRRNWVVDFGDLGWIKEYLVSTFDHRTLVAHDDPHFTTLLDLHEKRIIDIVTVRDTGCEAFAEMIYDHVSRELLEQNTPHRVRLVSVKVAEHGSNSATYYRERI